jgi:excisionase family DNA binding protein
MNSRIFEKEPSNNPMMSNSDILTAQQATTILERLEALRQEVSRLRAVTAIPQREYFSVKETSKILGISEKCVRRLLKCRELPCANFGGPQRPTFRISRADINTWVASRRVLQAEGCSEREARVKEYFPRFHKRQKSQAS